MIAVKRTSLQFLPNDPDKLKDIIAQLTERVHALEEFIRLEKLRKFAARSEKVSSDQFELFNEGELCEVAESGLAEQEQALSTEVETPSLQRKAEAKAPGRKSLPADLPRVRIEYDLSDDQKACSCGCERVVIGEETSEQLDIINRYQRAMPARAC